MAYEVVYVCRSCHQEHGHAPNCPLDPAVWQPAAPPTEEPDVNIGVNFTHTPTTGWRHDSLISGVLTKTQGDRFRCILNNACSELNEHVGNPRVSEPLTAEDALTQIHEAIDWKDWTPKRVEEIAAILRRAGKDVHSADEIPF